ncbi:hypothetical protein LTR36_004866 [Oleoguttula mirabilis]|uniref:Uncharacterized protein n=1 Tax=Oleoguttula mirabilis TaxID=1507867 RepID=A0AAV9JFN9_9PEZI|nr:hypothetical protein LTR36_004866 [Oleoguttula mirabilis]
MRHVILSNYPPIPAWCPKLAEQNSLDMRFPLTGPEAAQSQYVNWKVERLRQGGQRSFMKAPLQRKVSIDLHGGGGVEVSDSGQTLLSWYTPRIILFGQLCRRVARLLLRNTYCKEMFGNLIFLE